MTCIVCPYNIQCWVVQMHGVSLGGRFQFLNQILVEFDFFLAICVTV